MREFQLVFKKTAVGFEVYYIKNAPITQIEKFIKLEFILKSKNPVFGNFTSQADLLNSNQIFYFSNLNTNPEPNKEVPLSRDQIVGSNDMLPVESPESLEQKIFQPTDRNPQESSLYDAYGLEHFHSTSEDKKITLPDGRFQLNMGSSSQDIYCSNSPLTSNTIGIIDIYIWMKEGHNFSLHNTEELVPVEYKIQFKSRSVFWRYNLIQTVEKFVKFEIKNILPSNSEDSKQYLFNQVSNDTRMPDRSKIEQFVSTSEIPIKEDTSPLFKIFLWEDPLKEASLNIVLPSPKTANFSVEKINEEPVYYADIFVYI
ncbi:MAG: hypothetical protein KDC69_11335 [Flavobacteriaceae bacterium]|nr:hypothetical protein [Flavobacteriaceae bacterium]MCB0706871.1 hypothetical protein [Saprospiraceae bacterium]